MLTLGLGLITAQVAPTIAATQPQTILTGGGCASIPGVGSPILMINNAHRFIEDSLNIKNTYTNVKYLYFLKTSPATNPNVSNFRLVFSVTDYNNTKYIAIDLDQSPFGIGSTKIVKFLMTSDIAKVRQFIDPNFTTNVTFSCGDLKYVYSSFGTSPTNPLDYNFPGRNQNSAGLNVLNNLLPSSGASAALPVGGPNANNTPNKVCVTANFIETTNFFGTATAATPVDLVRCLPRKNGVASISIGCVNNTVQSIQLFFNDLNNRGTTPSIFVGNPNTPATAITNIDLSPSDRIIFTRTSTPDSIRIQTVADNGANLTDYVCGLGATNTNSQTVLTNNFLGFGNIFASANGVNAFDIVSYNM